MASLNLHKTRTTFPTIRGRRYPWHLLAGHLWALGIAEAISQLSEVYIPEILG